MDLEGADIAQHLMGWLNAVRSRPRIAGHVFTQLTDVEWERNGLVTYHRRAKDFGLLDEDSLPMANAADAVVLSGLPGQILQGGQSLDVNVQLARGGDGSAMRESLVVLRWAWGSFDEDLDQADIVATGELELTAGWGLHDAGIIEIEGLGQDATLMVEATIDGEPIARTERRYTAE